VARAVPLDAFLQHVQIPHVEFVFEEVDVLAWVVVFGGFAFEVGRPREVDDVDQHVGLVEIREELVAQATALVCAGDETGHVDQSHRHEASALLTVPHVGRAGVVELGGRTLDTSVGLAHAGIDRRERVGPFGHVVHRRRVEESGLADRRLADESDVEAHGHCQHDEGLKRCQTSGERV